MLQATRSHRFSSAVAVLALGSLVTGAAEAGDATYLPLDAGYCEIFSALSNELPAQCQASPEALAGMKTRSIRVIAPAKPKTAVVGTAVVPLPNDEAAARNEEGGQVDDLSLAMPIQFEYDSDILTDEAEAGLDVIASVITSDIMKTEVIMLEGHADATGPEAYNLSLSIRRARSVQRYLIQVHGIEDWRLPFVGKGESELYDEAAPTSAANRRVEFSNITG